MAEPTLYFLYNTGGTDDAYGGTGEDLGNWKNMEVVTSSGIPDTLVFTGGGINAAVSTPTAAYGSREATLRPVSGDLVIPQTFIESYNDNIMRDVPLAGQTIYQYVMVVYIDGAIASDLYLEAWDDNTFTTTDSPVLSGTVNYPYSMINAVRTTEGVPSAGWDGSTYGSDRSNYLSGYDNRVKLKGADAATNESLYYNIYVSLPYDAPLFHGTPILSFRYLYV